MKTPPRSKSSLGLNLLATATLLILPSACKTDPDPPAGQQNVAAAQPANGAGGRIFADADTPIKVRGGAMTFYTNNAWTPPLPSSGSTPNTSYCSPADISVVTIKDSSNDGTFNAPATLPASWELELKAKKNNVKISAQPAPCPGGTSAASVTVSVQTASSTVGFYLTDLAAKEDSRRFLDTTCGDQDACERLRSGTLKDPKGNVITTFDCKDFDCTVRIGAPLPSQRSTSAPKPSQ